MTRHLRAPQDDTADIFHGVTVPDPFRQLEDSARPDTQAWIAAQNAHLEDFLAPYSDIRTQMRQWLQTRLNYPRQSVPSHYGRSWFRSFNPGLAPQPIQQIAAAPNGPWRTLIEPLRIDPTGVTSIMDIFPSPDGKLVAYTVSVGGDDRVTLRVINAATGEELPDSIPDCRFTAVTWDADGQGFHYNTPINDDMRNRIRHHRLGDDAMRDRDVYLHDHPESFVSYWRSRHDKRDFAIVAIGTSNQVGYWLRDMATEEFTCLVPVLQEEIQIIDVIDDQIYAVTKRHAQRGELVRFTPAAPEQRDVIVPEHAQNVLTGGFYRHGKFFLTYSDDTADAVTITDLHGNITGAMPLPIQSTLSIGHDNEGDDGVYLSISGFLTPGTQYFYDYHANTLMLFATSAAPETLEDCVIERLRAPSKDGTLVPMTVIRQRDTKLDGTAALKLHGYGGFNQPLGPNFNLLRIVSWVRAGGIFVQTNLRGGGEFGLDWYRGGILRNKQNVFDDFIACAEHLIAKNYTCAKRLVSQGGSNGGLLTAATMLQRPDLFGCVLSDVPVMDMLRFDQFTYGMAWKSDYGDPRRDAADFNTAMAYSPLHNIKQNADYPPHLVMTADKDTRVVPMHSYKFIATMQQANPDALSFLHAETDAGHGDGVALDKVIAEYAMMHAFCIAALGPIDQNEFKQQNKQQPL